MTGGNYYEHKNLILHIEKIIAGSADRMGSYNRNLLRNPTGSRRTLYG